MSMKTMLDLEIEELFNELSNTARGSKEYTAIEDDLTKLVDRRLELEKMEVSEAQTEQQMQQDRKARIVKNLIDIGSIVLPLAVTIWGARASFRFEQEGTITTSIGRKFMDKIVSKK